MERFKEFKEFINETLIKDAISKDNWDYVYRAAEQFFDYGPSILTYFLTEAEIQPLYYMKDVPSYFGSNAANLITCTIPKNINKIKEYAFKYCDNLQSVIIEEGVVEIGAEAFYGCSNLSKINIPHSIEKIGSLVFHECNRLKEISLPKELSYLSPFCFTDSEIDIINYEGNANEWNNLLLRSGENLSLKSKIAYGKIKLNLEQY